LLDQIVAFCAGGLFGFLVLGYRVKRSMKQVRELAENIDIPVEALISFALFDVEGNQLTERSLVFVGGDGSNSHQIAAPVIRTGQVHHGVLYMGEYGALIDEMSPLSFVRAGDLYVIGEGNWHMQLDAPDE